MAEAMIAEKYFTADAALRYKYEQREKFLRDQRSREEYARAEGRAEGKAEGKAEGRKEGKVEAVKNLMKNTGWPLEEAMEALGLDEESRNNCIKAFA